MNHLMRNAIANIMELVAFAAITTGVGLLAGAGAALIVGGGLLAAAALTLEHRR